MCGTVHLNISRRNHKSAVECNYIEASHDIRPCHGIGSVVKVSCLRAVAAGKVVISDAESLLSSSKDKLRHGALKREKAGKIEISKWNFLLVETENREWRTLLL